MAGNSLSDRATLLVSGLPHEVTVEALLAHFCRWGQVDRVQLSPDPASVHPDTLSGVRPAWALVAFVDPTSVDAVLSWSGGEHKISGAAYELRRFVRAAGAWAGDRNGSEDEASGGSARGVGSSDEEEMIAGLRDRYGCLMKENQRLAALVYEKDKATRLLLANVEAWKQKLDWVEKKKVEDMQRLQACLREREQLIQQLMHGGAVMRGQLEQLQATETASQAGARQLGELERENAALLDILHGKSRDNPSVQQLLASLQTVKQDLKLRETENARLVIVVGQRDKQLGHLSARLAETEARWKRLAWEAGGVTGAPGGADTIRELATERDRLKAQLAAIGKAAADGEAAAADEEGGKLRETLGQAAGAASEADADADANDNKENLPAAVVVPAKPPPQPIGSGSLAKQRAKTAAAAAAGEAAEVADGSESPGSALTAAFGRLAVGSGRAPLCALKQSQ